MFTGIIQDIGRIGAIEARGGDVRLRIEPDHLDTSSLRIGDSVCVQGCCLTAVEILGRAFSADVSVETLRVTTLGELRVGSPVNLEPSLRAGDPLGGHLVSGHVDGVGVVIAVTAVARSHRLAVTAPPALARFVAAKGSVAIDGVSLTVNDVDGAEFAVNIIPHTQAVTTLGALMTGARVNLEVDQMARYAERLLSCLPGRLTV